MKINEPFERITLENMNHVQNQNHVSNVKK